MGRIWTNHWLERHKSFETMMERYAGVECEHLRAKVSVAGAKTTAQNGLYSPFTLASKSEI
eukprot:scaffold72661_cov20-Tisochrysis_lutea.AAC.2